MLPNSYQTTKISEGHPGFRLIETIYPDNTKKIASDTVGQHPVDVTGRHLVRGRCPHLALTNDVTPESESPGCFEEKIDSYCFSRNDVGAYIAAGRNF